MVSLSRFTSYIFLTLLFISCAPNKKVHELDIKQQALEKSLYDLKMNFDGSGVVPVEKYKLAKEYINLFKEKYGVDPETKKCKKDCVMQAYNMQYSLFRGISAAQFSNLYIIDEEFNGVRIYYGLRGDTKVAILIPVNRSGRALHPEDSDEVIVVELLEGFTGPCPELCDYIG